MSEKTLLLVDGSSYLYRAYHALPDLRGPGGVPTGALRGVVSMLKLLREQHPAALGACVFDAKGKTFRDDWYAEYKANRSAMPDDLALQIAPIHEAVKLLGWPLLNVPGVEADDVIGTLCKTAAAAGYEVIVSTGDKDLAQLVDGHVTLVNTMNNERLDPAGVVAKFGVAPERIVDYLTLVGDAVDNIPGVDKVGPKTAAKWIAEHGSLDGVIAAAPTMKGAAGENLRKALDWLPQGRRLVTVATDCDLVEHVPGWPKLQSLAFAQVDAQALGVFYDRYDFKSFKRELESAAGVPASTEPSAHNTSQTAAIEKRYETILTDAQLQTWLAKIEAAPLTAIDTETDSLDGMRAQIVGISLSVEAGRGGLHPAAPQLCRAHRTNCPSMTCSRNLKPWLENPDGVESSARTSSTTPMCSPTPVSPIRLAMRTTPCCESYVLEAHKPHSLESLAVAPPRPQAA